MKHSLLFCISAFYIIIHTSCSHVPEQRFFPQEHLLTSERIPLDRPFRPDAMVLKDGFLIFSVNHSTIGIYSPVDYSFKYSLKNRQQPDDRSLFQIVGSSSPDLYVMNVSNNNEIKKYRIDSIGQPILLQISFIGSTGAMNRPYILHDSLIVYDEFIPDASLKIHNLHTNTEALALPYGTTSFENRFFDKNMGGLYANDLCLVFAYKYQHRIDFYDWQFNLTHSVNHQKSDPVINTWNDFHTMPDNTTYYGTSYMGRNYFYTLYRGVSSKVFRSDSVLVNKKFNSYVYGLTRDVLEVYDMSGQPVCRFHFNDVAPAVFVVDEEHNRLYGHREAYPDSLLIYHLKGLSQNGKKYPDSSNPILSSLPIFPISKVQEESVHFIAISWQIDVAPTYLVRSAGLGGQYVFATEACNAYTAQVEVK